MIMTELIDELRSTALDLETAAVRLGARHEAIMSKISELQSKISQARAVEVAADETL